VDTILFTADAASGTQNKIEIIPSPYLFLRQRHILITLNKKVLSPDIAATCDKECAHAL